MKKLVYILCLISSASFATEIQFGFKSPSFNGVGYSSHVLTIENLEATRKQKIFDDRKSAAEKAASDAKNTNLAKFLNNLESRIYATISQNIASELFKDNGNSAYDSPSKYKLPAEHLEIYTRWHKLASTELFGCPNDRIHCKKCLVFGKKCLDLITKPIGAGNELVSACLKEFDKLITDLPEIQIYISELVAITEYKRQIFTDIPVNNIYLLTINLPIIDQVDLSDFHHHLN
jgi:hypothetical protein